LTLQSALRSAQFVTLFLIKGEQIWVEDAAPGSECFVKILERAVETGSQIERYIRLDGENAGMRGLVRYVEKSTARRLLTVKD